MSSPGVLLELDLAHGLLEAPPADPITAIRARNVPVLRTVIERLRVAAESPAVKGLIAHVGPEVLTAAQVEELGAAVEALGKAGKRTVCWTEAFGETGNGTLSYHLASYFDEIWLQESGGLGLVGTAAGAMFLRGALDKVGVQPQIHARHEYKNAPDSLMREGMTGPQREAMQRLVDSLTEGTVRTIARRRKLSEADVRAAIEVAPLTPAQALERGFVDHIGYRDEAYAATKQAVGSAPKKGKGDDAPELEQRFVHKWTEPAASRARRAPGKAVSRVRSRGQARVIAVVTVDGGIMLGRSGTTPLQGPHTGSDSIAAALRLAGEADDVAGVVLRVVSPGGSYVASDAIHREVLRLKAQGKPIVASMGTVAASGGYFVAMAADEIFALPTTITGSIGVFAGKVVTRDAYGKVGINRELVADGPRSTMWSPTAPFTEDELAQLDRWLDDVYADFTEKAAAGRGMPVDQLEPLARGRVWTGTDAQERGLVDTLGGLDEAITAAATRAGRSRDEITARPYPHASPVARLRSPQHSDAPTAAVAASWLRGTAGPLLGGLPGAAGVGLALGGLGAVAGLGGVGAVAGLGGIGAVAGPGVGAGPERLLAELGLAAGLAPGALRLPTGLLGG